MITNALMQNPQGVRTGVGQVQWEGGSVVMTVAPTSDSLLTSASDLDTSDAVSVPSAAAGTGGCRSVSIIGTGYDWSCVYNNTDFRGTRLQFKDTGSFQSLDNYVSGWVTYSWSNTRSGRAWLFPKKSLSSNPSLCMSPNSAAGYPGGSALGDTYIYLSTNKATC
jgi:hypothetical protein